MKRQGITPAWAGKRLPIGIPTSYNQDHPRVGGEKIQQGTLLEQDQGSPPRGRGKD